MQKNFLKIIPLLIFSFASISFLFAQQTGEDLKPVIKAQAQKVIESVFNEDYESLIKYTHPSVVEISGGKEALIKTVKSSMEHLKKNNFQIKKLEITDGIIVSKYDDIFHCLVPKSMIISMGGQTLKQEGYLFGFSDPTGKEWTFLEAAQIKSEEAKVIFPEFKTNIEIPDAPPPSIE